MFESAFVFFVVTMISIGILEEIVVPATHHVIDMAAPVVDKAIDYVNPSTTDE